MAHFAELNESNVVLRVCVVDNSHVPSDMHVDGETWCTNFWGGTWKQTSYNSSFRKRFAGIGYLMMLLETHLLIHNLILHGH